MLKAKQPAIWMLLYMKEPPVAPRLDESLLENICANIACRKTKKPIGVVQTGIRPCSNRQNQDFQSLAFHSTMCSDSSQFDGIDLPGFQDFRRQGAHFLRRQPSMQDMVPHGAFQRLPSQRSQTSFVHPKPPPPPPPHHLAIGDYAMQTPQHSHMPALMPPPVSPFTPQSDESQSSQHSHMPPATEPVPDPNTRAIVPFVEHSSSDHPLVSSPTDPLLPYAGDQKPEPTPDQLLFRAKKEVAKMSAEIRRRADNKAEDKAQNKAQPKKISAAPKPPPKKATPKAIPTSKSAPAPKKQPSTAAKSAPASACRSLITHEQSREQFLVRIAGESSRTFAYNNGKRSMKQARMEAEAHLAKYRKC